VILFFLSAVAAFVGRRLRWPRFKKCPCSSYPLRSFAAPASIVRGDAPVLAGPRLIGDLTLEVADNFAAVLYLASSSGMGVTLIVTG